MCYKTHRTALAVCLLGFWSAGWSCWGYWGKPASCDGLQGYTTPSGVITALRTLSTLTLVLSLNSQNLCTNMCCLQVTWNQAEHRNLLNCCSWGITGQRNTHWGKRFLPSSAYSTQPHRHLGLVSVTLIDRGEKGCPLDSRLWITVFKIHALWVIIEQTLLFCPSWKRKRVDFLLLCYIAMLYSRGCSSKNS